MSPYSPPSLQGLELLREFPIDAFPFWVSPWLLFLDFDWAFASLFVLLLASATAGDLLPIW